MPPTTCIRLSLQNGKVEKRYNSEKSNLKFTQILSDHLHTGSKLLAKCHEPYLSGSLDMLLIRF